MDNYAVHIGDRRGFWHTEGQTYVRGHAFLDGELLRPRDLIRVVKGMSPFEIEVLLQELTGFFSIIHVTEDIAVIATDHIQSYPLFYSASSNGVYISNDAMWIREELDGGNVDPLLEFELLLTGFVSGHDTLYPKINQLGAGEYVIIEQRDGTPTANPTRYSRFEYRSPREVPEATLLEDLDEVIEQAFQRLIRVADGRQLAISLSGGPDSRLIACMLRRLGYDNLVAFTYGLPGNWDSTVAREVATALDIPLEIVEYTHEGWSSWFHSEQREQYYRYAFNYASIPSIGAVPAVGQLTMSGRIEPDAFVLCGNLAPSRFDYPPLFHQSGHFTEEDIAEIIIERYFSNWDWDDEEVEEVFKSRIVSQIDLENGSSLGPALAEYKDWRIRNLNAKTMIWPQEYGFWGHQSWTPLWDKQYTRFWEDVPIRFRHQKRLHRTYVEQLYQELTGESRPPAAHKPKSTLQRLESAIQGTIVEPLVKPVYERYESPYKNATRESPYHRDPLGTLGILDEELFEELCYSMDQDVHAFKALEIIGCVSFAPPVVITGPEDGTINLDSLQTKPRLNRRAALPWFDELREHPEDSSRFIGSP